MKSLVCMKDSRQFVECMVTSLCLFLCVCVIVFVVCFSVSIDRVTMTSLLSSLRSDAIVWVNIA